MVGSERGGEVEFKTRTVPRHVFQGVEEKVVMGTCWKIPRRKSWLRKQKRKFRTWKNAVDSRSKRKKKKRREEP